MNLALAMFGMPAGPVNLPVFGGGVVTDLTAERLRELLDYDPDGGIFTWKRSRGSVRKGQQAGCVSDGDYLRLRIDGRLYLGHRLAWLHVHGTWPPDELDHIHNNRSDTRLRHLRPASNLQNAKNARRHRDNKSGYKGVHWDNTGKRWGARIHVNGKSIYLGNFDSPEEAAEAYDKAARLHHGEFANTNF